jgi:hypothetical protein
MPYALRRIRAQIDGKIVMLARGDYLPPEHPLVRKFPDRFAVDRPVEQATAAPGEKRA